MRTDFAVNIIVVVFMLVLVGCMFWLYDIYKNEQPQVGMAIGTQNVYASGLSDETQKLVEDLRWKHHSFYPVQLEEWWEQQYPYMWFEDGIFYVAEKDVTWFMEMERKVKEE